MCRRLGNPMAWDVLSQSQVVAGDCDFFVAGFSCTARSRLNQKSGRNVNGVQNGGNDATAVTWKGTVACIQKRKPRMVILENVEELDRSDGPVADTHIVKLLRP